jgi:hypothetical protein
MDKLQKPLLIVMTILMASLPLLARTEKPDDLEFVRNALKNPGAQEIIIPEGSYTVNRPIVLNRDHASLVGRGKVVITLADHANSSVIILGNTQTPARPVYDLRVSNLILKGNRDNQDMECQGGPCDSGGETNIRNNGITIRGVRGSEITNIETLDMRSGGIVTEKGCSKLHINGWISKNNYFDGFAGYETRESLFENLDLSENMGAGISLDIRFHGNTFKNVLMSKNMDVGIFMRYSNNNKFIDHKIIDSGSHGIFASQVDYEVGTMPINNTFENFEFIGIKGNAFHLNHAGVGNKLVGPKFRNVRGQNIFEAIPGYLQLMCVEPMKGLVAAH